MKKKALFWGLDHVVIIYSHRGFGTLMININHMITKKFNDHQFTDHSNTLMIDQ
jgi:hypothetical protein